MKSGLNGGEEEVHVVQVGQEGSSHWTRRINKTKSWRKETERQRERERERDRDRETEETTAHKNKNRNMKRTSVRLSDRARFIILIWWAAPSQTPCTSILSKTFVLDSITIFSYIYLCFFFFFTSVCFLHLLSQKTRLLNKCIKNSYRMIVDDVWPELLLWIYCFVHWVMFGAACTLGSIQWSLSTDGLYSLRNVLTLGWNPALLFTFG